MAIETRIIQGKTVFNDWEVKEYIGSGSGGKTAVFRIVRRHDNWEEISALKVINVLEEMGKKDTLTDDYRTEYETERDELCKQAEEELRLMSCLRGNPYIVEYYDFLFVDYQEEYSFGTDLLIRMELLENLREEQKKKGEYSEAEIIHIGQNICKSLQFCHRAGIIHRDIKPANIFVTAWGDYKLGDFGIARMVDAGQKASTKMGTRAYAAPEQFMSHQDKYDERVDIYSLGLTLYELANHNRLPFASSGYVRESEIQLRIMGKEFPTPDNVSLALSEVIKKACTHTAEGRYACAQDFEKALSVVESGTSQLQKMSTADEEKTDIEKQQIEKDSEKVEKLTEKQVQKGKTRVEEKQAEDIKKKEKDQTDKNSITSEAKVVIILVIVLLAVISLLLKAFWNQINSNDKEQDVFVEKTEDISEQNEPEQSKSAQNSAEISLEMEKISNEYLKTFGEVAYVTATADNVAVITEKNELYMWGKNDYGQVGCGNTDDQKEPVLILENVDSVYLSEKHTAALTTEGELYLWGCNSNSQIGNNTKKNQLTPMLILENVKEVSLGDYHTGALCNNGDLYGWGKADGNGCGTEMDQGHPIVIVRDVVSFSMNDHDGGAVTKDGQLYVWGMNWTQQPIFGYREPTFIMANVKSIQVGEKTVAAIKKNGELYMWGYNDFGQVGNGTSGDVSDPELIMPNVKEVVLEDEQSAAITEDGELYMWGFNERGQIGLPGDIRYLVPQKITENVKSVYLGDSVTAFIKEDGELYLCGDNSNQQIVESEQLRINEPLAVAKNITSVGIYADKTYAVREDGSLYQWGK